MRNQIGSILSHLPTVEGGSSEAIVLKASQRLVEIFGLNKYSLNTYYVYALRFLCSEEIGAQRT